MSVPERRAMVERPRENLSVRRQCALLNLARSGVYRPGPVTGADDLALMRRIDELHLKWPFYGSRRMVFELNQAGHGINRKRVQRLMRVMGIEALVPRPGTSKAAPGRELADRRIAYMHFMDQSGYRSMAAQISDKVHSLLRKLRPTFDKGALILAGGQRLRKQMN
jgi:putative transposase